MLPRLRLDPSGGHTMELLSPSFCKSCKRDRTGLVVKYFSASSRSCGEAMVTFPCTSTMIYFSGASDLHHLWSEDPKHPRVKSLPSALLTLLRTGIFPSEPKNPKATGKKLLHQNKRLR